MRQPIVLPVILAAAIAAGLPGQAQDAGGSAAAIFARLDSDGNGRVTADEIGAAKARQFARVDRNADGLIDAGELEAMRARLARFAAMADGVMVERAMRLDADGDGALSLPEYTGHSPVFALLDSDGDGAVSEAEFKRGLAAFGQ